ncbi:creatininase family protein [candidate division KSB1 bacterium]|nr:creatininase family protein [candidate division KSB1 bacterium]
MSVVLVCMLTMSSFSAQKAKSQELSIYYEELTAPDFVKAVEKSGGTCIIPLGIMEKHGPHLPLGTDLIDVREVAKRAAEKEYSIIFPQYYFGQIFEAKHQPGTIAYSPQLIWNVLQETCDELARNGIKKIILVSGHGGNNHFLPYFCQAQLAQKKDYAVILFQEGDDPETAEKVRKLRKTTTGGHAGETETSMMLSHRPELALVERGKQQSGEDQKRLENLPYAYTGIWWYAKYPNHYAGDGSEANAEIGNLLINSEAEQLVSLIKALKKDNQIFKLQQLFYQQSENPLKTKQ